MTSHALGRATAISGASAPRRACGRSLIERTRALSPVVRQSSSVAASAISSHWGVLVDADRRTVNLKLGYAGLMAAMASSSSRHMTHEGGNRMRINVTSVLVDDQDKALRFYTDVLGFVKKTEIPLGEARWLTVVSPEDPDGTELLLEPDGHPAAKPFKQALVEDGIPFTSFAVDDIHKEFERLRSLGVQFTQEPAEMGPVTTAVFDDTCGNLI